jgi:hypothetical protein
LNKKPKTGPKKSKRTIEMISFADADNHYAYWIRRRPIERLAAVERLRQLYIEQHCDPSERRVQRILAVVKHKPR